MEIVFTFRATHNAILGEKTLMEGGVDVKVMPLPMTLGAGCGICLRVAEEEFPRARELLAAAGIAPQGVYEKRLSAGRAAYIAVTAADDR